MPAVVSYVGSFLVGVGSAVGAGAASAGVAMAVGAATVVAGAVVAKKLIENIYAVPNMDSDRSRQATVRGTVEPQKLIYGEALVSGPISFVGVSGPENRDLYHVIVLAGHKCEDVTDIYFDNEKIADSQINSSGIVTSGRFGPQDSNNICRINRYTGYQTQADSTLDQFFDSIDQNSHIGTNLTYIVTVFSLIDESQEIWDKYLPTDIKGLVKGRKIYDPRQDSTSTYYDSDVGVSTQRANDSTTWEWSENPVWCLVDYLTDDYFGMDIDLSRIDLAKAVAAADICDTLVDIPNSQQEKRFTCNGVLFGTATHKTNINKLLSSMNGMLTYTNGKFVIRAGAFEAVASGMTLSDDNLTGPASLKTSFERNERFNTVTGTFVDKNKLYKEMEFPRVQIASALTRDANEELSTELKLSMTNSFYMAQRISHKLIQQSDLQKVLTFPTNLAGINIAVGDRVSVTLSEFNYTNKTFVCLGWSLSESGTGGVNLILREDDSASYADMSPASYSTVAPDGGIEEGFAGVPDPQSLTATALIEGIELDWVNPLRMRDIISIEIFASPDSSWANAVKIGETLGTQFLHDASNGVDPIADGDERYYWVRARRFPTGTGTDAVSDRNPDSDTSTINATRGALGALASQDTVGDAQIDDNVITGDMIQDGEIQGKTLALLLNKTAEGNTATGEGALVGVNLDGTPNLGTNGSIIYNGSEITIEHNQYASGAGDLTFATQLAGKRGFIVFDINKTEPFQMSGALGDWDCAFVHIEGEKFYYDDNSTTRVEFDPSSFTGTQTGTDGTTTAHIISLGKLETQASDLILAGGLYGEPRDLITELTNDLPASALFEQVVTQKTRALTSDFDVTASANQLIYSVRLDALGDESRGVRSHFLCNIEWEIVAGSNWDDDGGDYPEVEFKCSIGSTYSTRTKVGAQTYIHPFLGDTSATNVRHSVTLFGFDDTARTSFLFFYLEVSATSFDGQVTQTKARVKRADTTILGVR